MHRRAFLWQIAVESVIFGAPNENLRMRVIYADASSLKDLISRPYSELGHLDDGAWVACPDDTVRALADRRAPLFLYFDRQSYDNAISGLTGAAIRDVIRRRRSKWAPQAQGYVLAWLFDLERVSLEAALAGVPNAVEGSLALLQRLAGLDRYRMEAAKGMAVEVLEAEAKLLACIESALHAGVSAARRQALASHLEQRKQWAQTVGRVAGQLGATQFANALPGADPERGVFLHPADSATERAISSAGEPAIRWRDGIVCVLPERRIAMLRSQGRSPGVLYAEAGDFYDSAEMLTTDQLHRDFAARLGRSAAETAWDFESQIDRLQLHQILLKRELCGRPDAARACRSGGLEATLTEEVAVLRASLGQNRSFSRLRGVHAEGGPDALFRLARDLSRADAALFAEVATKQWPSMAQQLREIHTALTAR